jgi:hypothetical protein
MSSNAEPLSTRTHARGVFLNPRARTRRNLFAIVLPLLALMTAPAVAGAHSEPPPRPAVPGLAYATGSERSSPAVWVANANGGQAKRLGLGLEPLISPNGQWVAASAFGAVVGTQEQGPAIVIYSTTAAAAPLNALSLATATAQPLAWSPDSRYLAVALQSTTLPSEAGSGLAVIDTTTGAVTTIAHGQIYGASFAQDGSDRIVYGRAPSLLLSAPTNLYVSGPEGSGTRAFTNNGHSLNPVWGPKYIAYDRERPRHDYASVFQIWLQPPGGGAARRVTDTHPNELVSGLVPLAFSSNGGRLLTQFEGQDTSEAWTVVVASGKTHRLTVRGQPVTAAGLSRDGSTVLIDEKSFEGPPSGGRVAQIPFAGGRPKVLVAHGAQASWNR